MRGSALKVEFWHTSRTLSTGNVSRRSRDCKGGTACPFEENLSVPTSDYRVDLSWCLERCCRCSAFAARQNHLFLIDLVRDWNKRTPRHNFTVGEKGSSSKALRFLTSKAEPKGMRKTNKWAGTRLPLTLTA